MMKLEEVRRLFSKPKEEKKEDEKPPPKKCYIPMIFEGASSISRFRLVKKDHSFIAFFGHAQYLPENRLRLIDGRVDVGSIDSEKDNTSKEFWLSSIYQNGKIEKRRFRIMASIVGITRSFGCTFGFDLELFIDEQEEIELWKEKQKSSQKG
jgi:hypothetical protein